MPRILIIDDDQPVREAIKMLLELDGLEVVVAEDGRAGLRALETATFDLVICDLLMPGMDGLETIKAFRRHSKTLPVLAVSGVVSLLDSSDQPGVDPLGNAQELGAIDTLRKPFRPHELLQKVHAWLGSAA
jgi:CheY-like chemotaxis protein